MATELAPFVGGHPDKPVSTVREDNWWIEPAITFVVFMGFIVYTTWAALQGKHFYASPYLSPYYSPVIFTHGPEVVGTAPLWHSWFGTWPSWWPAFLPPSPALFILPFPALFRFTCYYYRKAYYRAFTGSPPSCAVVPLAGQGKRYKGETAWLLFQNLHRYAMYFAVLYLPILAFDAGAAFVRKGQFGVGVGSLVLTINFFLLSGYTLGCHSFRHLIGGRVDCLSCGKRTARFSWWKASTWLNVRHGRFAWFSLFWVAFTDAYVRLVSMGVIKDFNTWG